MSNFRKFISVAAVAMLGVTNLLTPLSYANAADVDNYDWATNPISTAKSFSFLMPAHHVYLYATTEANKYFVDYHGNDGASWTMPEQMFTYDESWSLNPNAFVKTWYTWQSWNTTTGGDGTPYTSGQEVKNLTTQESGHYHIYAQWWANGYTIAYDLNQGSWTSVPVHGASHPTSATYDSGFTVSNPSRTWYSFSGWHITGMDTAYPHEVGWADVNDTVADGVMWTSFNNLRATSGTVHFAAKWNPDQVNYVINYYQQKLDGTYPETPTDTHTGTATADDFITWDLVEYSWFTTPSAQGTGIKPDGTTAIRYEYVRKSYDLELIAGKWVETVTVNSTSYSSGGTNSWTHTYSFKYDDDVALSFKLKPWYQTGTWSGYSGDSASFNMPAENISKTAYADLITYDLIIHPTWGSGAISTRTYNVEDENIPLGNPERDHSTFEWWTGWVINGTQLDWPTKNVVVTWWSIGNREYTATWSCDIWYHIVDTGTNAEQCTEDTNTQYKVNHLWQDLEWNYTVNLESYTGYGTTDTTTAVTGRDYVWFAPDHIDQTQIYWGGTWVVNAYYNRESYNRTIDVSTGVTVTTTADHSGGNSWPYLYQDTVTLNADVQSWYTFESWTVTTESGDITVTNPTSPEGATFTMPASDVTIKANVSTNTYHVSINKKWWEGGTDSGYAYTVEDTVNLSNPHRDNSTFVWWSWTDLEAVTHDVSFSGRAYDSSYEAVWSCNTWYHDNREWTACLNNAYTVTINYDDDDKVPQTVTTGFTYDETWHIDIPQKSWYTFKWWSITWMTEWVTHYMGDQTSTAATASGVEATEFKNLATWGTVTFTAIWEANEDTKYKVYYFTEDTDGSGYTLVDSGVRNGTSDVQVAVSSLVYDISWYNTPTLWYLDWGASGPSGSGQTAITIDRHGTTEIYLFYDRGTFHVYLSGDAHVTSLSGEWNYRFWDTVNVSATVQSWYHFKEWQKKSSLAELWRSE